MPLIFHYVTYVTAQLDCFILYQLWTCRITYVVFALVTVNIAEHWIYYKHYTEL
jgi:hypothetical protein